MKPQALTLDTLEEKIEHLETRQTFQEDTIELLNLVVIQYQKDLERLQLQISNLAEQIQQSDNPFAELQVEEPPPHY